MSSRFLTLFTSIACAASVAQAQTKPSLPGPAAGDETLHLNNIVVTANPLARAQDEIAVPTHVLAGEAFTRRLQSTLGETLAGLPGIDSTYFGPGASRPIIRGLGGDRIRVLAGGIGTLDASVVSPDHAVSLEPLLIERVEIVRGPAALLFGGGAVGGVVNVVDGRVPEALPAAPVTGRFEARGNSVAAERAGVGVLTGAAGKWAWRLDGFKRETDDVEVPDGPLVNSATATSGGAAGLSYIGTDGHFGLAYSGFDSLYGVVAEEDVRIDLRQRRWDAHGEWLKPTGWLRAGKFNLGVADYRHDELDGDEVGTRFKNRGYEGRGELLHEKIGAFEGALGVQASRSALEAIGDEAFLPPTVTKNHALFLYEEAVTGALTWQTGARTEWQKITPEAGTKLKARSHSLATFTGGAVWKVREDYTLALALSANERAPNTQELFANGPHVGTGTFEVGDPTLGTEKSVGLDLSLRKRRGFVTGEISFFLNKFDGYIYENATGAVKDRLPVFAFVQRDAELRGGEVEITFHLHDSQTMLADVRVFADTVRATNTSDDTALPRTTPTRIGVGFDWRSGPWSFTAELRDVANQRRTAPIENATDGYQLLSIGAAWRFETGLSRGEIFLRGANLLDATARVHASFLKDVAPLPGRDFAAGVRWSF